MSDIYFEQPTLQGVVNALPVPKIGLTGEYFTAVVESDRPEIMFDIESMDLRMTPFCHPLVEAPMVESLGYKSNIFRPAYLKEKTAFTTTNFNTRTIGEQPNRQLSKQERLMVALREDMRVKLNRLNLRLEWMGTRAMLDGKITVQGASYPATVVDFGRNANNTIALGSGNKWGSSGVKPLELLKAWANQTVAPVSDWYMSADAYGAFIADADVQKRMDMNMRGTNTISNDAVLGVDATMMGFVDGFRIWVMPRVTVPNDDNGTAELLFPEKTVLGVARSAFIGVRHFGAIEDVEAVEQGRHQGMYFAKSWINPDPSVRYTMIQSAPLLVPYRPDATVKAIVL